jgi:hypothetical protein
MFQRLPAGLYKVDDVLLRARLTVDQDGFSDAALNIIYLSQDS